MSAGFFSSNTKPNAATSGRTRGTGLKSSGGGSAGIKTGFPQRLQARLNTPVPRTARSQNSRRALGRCGGFLNGVCGGSDHVNHEARVREHGNVAAADLIG